MKALVTGGGGFLGKAIATKLLARRDEVEVRSLSRKKHAELESLGVEHIQGDLADTKWLSPGPQMRWGLKATVASSGPFD